MVNVDRAPSAAGAVDVSRVGHGQRRSRLVGCGCSRRFPCDMHQYWRPSQRALVSAALREVFNADDHAQARERVTHVIEQLKPNAPKVAELLADAEPDLLAFYAFPREH